MRVNETTVKVIPENDFTVEKEIYKVSVKKEDSKGRKIDIKKLLEGFGHINPNINARHFPFREKEYGDKRIVLINSKLKALEVKFVLQKAIKEFGFKRPSYEDALFFSEEFRSFKYFKEVIFLHEPLIVSGKNRVIAFCHSRIGRDIYLYHPDDKIHGPTCFGFLI